jgi:hypothetical protein
MQNAPQMVLQFLRQGSDQPLPEQTVDISPSPSMVTKQLTEIHATVLGAGSIPASAWHAGLEKDLVSTQQLADMIPKSSLTADKPGVIALRLQNNSPDTIELSDAKGEQLTRLLGQESFRGGPYTFNGKIKSVRGGAFSINVVLTPLLAPIKGEAAVR